MKTKQTRTLILLSTVAFVALNGKAYGSSVDVIPSSEAFSVVDLAPTIQAAPGWVAKVTNFGAGSFVGGLGEDFLTQFKPKSSVDSVAASGNPTVVALSKLQALDHYLQLGLNDQLAAALVAVLGENTEVKDTKQREVDAFVNALLKAFQDKSAILEAPSSDMSQAADLAAEKASLQARSGAWHGFLNQSLADLSEYTDKIADKKAAEQVSLAGVEESKARTLAIAAEELGAFMAEKAKAIDAISATAESDTETQEVLKKGIREVAASRIEEQTRAQDAVLATRLIEDAKVAVKSLVAKHFEERDAQMALEIAARDQEIAASKERKVAALTAEDDKETAFRADASRAASELEAKVAADIAGIQSATQSDLAGLKAEFETRHGPYVAPVLTKGWMEWQATFETRQSSVSLKMFNALLAEIIPPTVSIMAESGGGSATAGELTATEPVVVPGPLVAVTVSREDFGYASGDESVVTSDSGLRISKPTSVEDTAHFMSALEASRGWGKTLPTPPAAAALPGHDAFSARTALQVQLSQAGTRTVTVSEREEVVISGNTITIEDGSINVDGVRSALPQTLGHLSITASGDLTFGSGAEVDARMFSFGSSNGAAVRTSDAPTSSYATAVILGSGVPKAEDGLDKAVSVTRAPDSTSYSFVAPLVAKGPDASISWANRMAAPAPRPMMTTIRVGSGNSAPRPMMMEPLLSIAEAKPVPVPATRLDMSAAATVKGASGGGSVPTGKGSNRKRK